MIEPFEEFGLLDRSGWASGPWDTEADLRLWTDQGTDFLCMIMRVPGLGHLCGYVGVPKDSPLAGLHYDNDRLSDIHVHGGLTYAGTHPTGEKHRDIDKMIDGYYFYGFDCAHYPDAVPMLLGTHLSKLFEHASYRDIAYVTKECYNLARQLKELGA